MEEKNHFKSYFKFNFNSTSIKIKSTQQKYIKINVVITTTQNNFECKTDNEEIVFQ